MARVAVSPIARGDIAKIIRDLAENAGYRVAANYVASFEKLFDRLALYPASGASRSKLGGGVRIGLVSPYVVFYRYARRLDLVEVIRLLHGRRHITRKLLRGGS